jgi:ring-1,2-phenylacetyl-CoA epoxidase subunit PaaD
MQPINLKPSLEKISKLIASIPDPEIPVITIEELGILRSVEMNNEELIITITPTYSGCPAMKTIEDEIKSVLKEEGIANAQVKTVYSPAWTTDWMTDEAKEKLEKYGISPPGKLSKLYSIAGDRAVACPRCGSTEVTMVSMFGSTACKALYKCNKCLEPFDQFKCH